MRKLTLFILLFATQLHAQISIDRAGLDTYLAQMQAMYKVPNLSVAITNRDTIVYTYGDADEVYLIGSNAKSFTALLALQLVQNRQLDLDTPVNTILKGVGLPGVTVRHLLNQTSGLPTEAGHTYYANDGHEAEYLKRISATPLVHAPGEAFTYSNANYLLLGLVIEQIERNNFANVLDAHIARPLRMWRTSADYQKSVGNGLVSGNQTMFGLANLTTNRPYQNVKAPEGYISSSGRDMSRYLAALLRTDSTLLRDSALWTSLFTPVHDGYAMGWGETHYFGTRVRQHLGLTETFNSAMFLLGDTLGVATMANTNSVQLGGAIKEGLVLHLLGKSPAPTNAENTQRYASLVLPLLWLWFCVTQLARWWKNGFRIGLPKWWRVLIALIISGLCLAPVILLPKMGGLPQSHFFNYQPDYAIGLRVLAVCGVLGALVFALRRREA